MKKLLFATGNASKVKRFSTGLLKKDIEIVSLKDLNLKLEVEENGIDVPSNVVNDGYPLNSISKYRVLDKYFSEITEEDKEKIKVNEDHVVDFISESINKD